MPPGRVYGVAPMWSGLRERELGAPPWRYAASVRRMRSHALELCKTKDVISSGRGAVNSLQIDPVEARYMLAGNGNGSISVYDISQPTTVEHYSQKHEALFSIDKAHRYSVSSVRWYPVDTGIFISGSFDKHINVWDANTLEVLMQFKMPGKVFGVSMSPVSTTHMLIATGTEDYRIRLCDISSGAFTHTLSAHRDAVWAVKWSASSEWILISGGCDGAIRLWDIRRAGCFYVLDQHRSSASQEAKTSKDATPGRVHPGLTSALDRSTAHYGTVTSLQTSRDGHYLLSAEHNVPGSDSRVKLWDIERGCNTLVNYEATNINGNLTCELEVSGDKPLVFVPCLTSIQVYDMLSGRLLSTLKGHYELVKCCAYHSQSQELYSGSNDRRILVWSPEQSVSEDEALGTIAAQVQADEDNWSD
ncbi:DNA excision repair protein ERCC-8 [Selaginella moellendorffii]|uniref:DNA excision repair protein ERCC-8 n=1 Tax=Selaginella moellendorffii TaxID=88036 RepID=UPI000D1CC3DA|nr:DNA excision repair protein ERCC-8 [Selaginella moellendorffii]|eukprot:XP_024539928.1 DNA excision repair protein ERCC-8 [Selaginella moellendorffii]